MMKKITNLDAGDYHSLIQQFLARLLEKETVYAVLVAKRYPKGRNAAPVLVRDPEKLDGCAPLAPVQGFNAAHAIVELTREQPGMPAAKPRRIAALIRPCEIRATIELIKLKQVQPDNVFLIGFDCPGVYNLKTYRDLPDDRAEPLALARASVEGDPEDLREACRLCTSFTGDSADLSLAWMGSDAITSEDGSTLLVDVRNDRGEELLRDADAEDVESPPEREAAVSKKHEEREQRFNEDAEELLTLLGPCVRCYNCREVCPICYCKDCLLKPEKMGYTPERHLNRAAKKGQLKMPLDTVLYHLTKMNHMATSCVACGVCEQACPMDIPLGRIYNRVGRHAQALFDYVAGRDREEQLPVTTFREDELADVQNVKKETS